MKQIIYRFTVCNVAFRTTTAGTSILSPTLFSHWEIFPSVMVELSAGIVTVEPPSTACIVGMRMRVRPLREAGTCTHEESAGERAF